MVSDSKRKANDRYDREHMTYISMKLHRTNDADIIEFLKTKENRTDYLRGLIRADMGKG